MLETLKGYLAGEQTESKPGLLTSEFWVIVVILVLTNLKTLPFPSKYNWIVDAAGILAYALSRGLAKMGVPNIPPDPGGGDYTDYSEDSEQAATDYAVEKVHPDGNEYDPSEFATAPMEQASIEPDPTIPPGV